MDYNWLGDHDPITIDANLAEIDFDDFKNEDIQNAYAYSLQSYVSIITFIIGIISCDSKQVVCRACLRCHIRPVIWVGEVPAGQNDRHFPFCNTSSVSPVSAQLKHNCKVYPIW